MKFLSYLGGLALIVLLVAAVYLFAQPVSTWFADLSREVTQHSQQYTESKTSLLLSLIQDYEDPSATLGQQGVIETRFCEEATRIDRTEWPSTVARFYTQHC